MLNFDFRVHFIRRHGLHGWKNLRGSLQSGAPGAAMPADGQMLLGEQERRLMQLPDGVPLGAFLSFPDLRSVRTSQLVADTTLPQLIAGLPWERTA